MKPCVVRSVLLSITILTGVVAQERLEELLRRISEGSADAPLLRALEGQPEDSRTIPALRRAFERGTTLREKSWLASALIRLGDHNSEFVTYLISAAKTAVEDPAPYFAKSDADGNYVRGELDAGFENWCRANGKDTMTVIGAQSTIPEVVAALAQAEAPAGKDVFRKGLESSNPAVVGYSVEGLGRLRDLSSLPIIKNVAKVAPKGIRIMISMNLPWYDTPEALGIMRELTPRAESIDYYIRMVRMEQTMNAENARKRRAQAPR